MAMSDHAFYKDYQKVKPSMSRTHIETEYKSILAKLANSYNRISVKHIDDWVVRFSYLDFSVKDFKETVDNWINTQKYHPSYAELKDMLMNKRPETEKNDAKWLEHIRKCEQQREIFLKNRKQIINTVGQDNYNKFFKIYISKVYGREFYVTLDAFNLDISHFERLMVNDLYESEMNSQKALEIALSKKGKPLF